MDKTKIGVIPATLTVMSITLLTLRILYTESIMFAFLMWNLFLAYIPYWITRPLAKTIIIESRKIILGSLFLVWLVFLPNAPYILTDLFHLSYGNKAPVWFDLILILTFAINGFVLWFISVVRIHNLIKEKYGFYTERIFIIAIIILSSTGIYIGRYGRWNSWDIVTNPYGLFTDILYRITHPLSFPALYGMTFLFSIFLGSGYYFLRQSKPDLS